MLFGDVDQEYYPPADAMVDYLGRFAVKLGLGRTVALHNRSSTSYQIF